jgi:hypothetical protein
MISPILLIVACNKNASKYENLENEKKVTIAKNPTRGYAIDSITKKASDFYVNLDTKDTNYSKTGMVINNALIKTPKVNTMLNDAKIKSDGDGFKGKSDHLKIKSDGDEIKIKTDDQKIKIDGNEQKVKNKD